MEETLLRRCGRRAQPVDPRGSATSRRPILRLETAAYPAVPAPKRQGERGRVARKPRRLSTLLRRPGARPLYSPGTPNGRICRDQPSPPRPLDPANGRCPHDEANVPAEHAPPQAQARLPPPDEDAGRQGDPQVAEGEGPSAALRLSSALPPMPSIEALSGRPHFARVHSSGRRCSRDGVTAIVSPRDEGPARLGLSVARSAGKAVVRNKIRRRLREAFRAYEPGPVDVVLIGRGAVATQPFSALEEHVKECLRIAGAPRRAS